MKRPRIIGLIALMALMAMAFVGATSVMAEPTALCKADETSCSEANLITSVHEVSVGKAKALTSIGTVECNVLFASTSVGAPGAPQILKGNFTYTNCELGEGSCTATEENGPAELKVLKEGHETAKVTYEYLVHLKCGAIIDCSYTGTGLEGTAKGPLLSAQTPDNGEVSLLERSLTKEAGGLLCPKTVKLDITTTPLTAAYLGGKRVTGSTVLCAADENPCVENGIGHVHETSVGKAKLLSSVGTAECNVLFLGSVKVEVSSLAVEGNFTYSNCELGGASCTAKEENGPTKLEVSVEGHETADVTGKGLVHLVCPKKIDCSYNGTGLKGTAKGPLLSEQTPDNGEVSLSEQEMTKEVGGLLCPKTAKLDITTSPLTATYIST